MPFDNSDGASKHGTLATHFANLHLMGHPICDMHYTPRNFPQQKKSVFTLITLITERIAQFGASNSKKITESNGNVT